MANIVNIYGPKNPALPPMRVMAVNIAGAIIRTAAGSMAGRPVTVPPEVEAERRAKCTGGCPHFRSDNRCALCGCYFKMKVKLAEESCPDNPARWGKWPDKDNA